MKNVLLLSAVFMAGSLCAAPTRHSVRLTQKELAKKAHIISVYEGTKKTDGITKQDRNNFEAMQVSLFNKENNKPSLNSLDLAGILTDDHSFITNCGDFGLMPESCTTPIKLVSPSTPLEIDPIKQVRQSARLLAAAQKLQNHVQQHCIGCDNY